jgi:hypothetical protein
MFDRSLGMRYFVHWGLFIASLKNNGTEEQKRKWVPLAEDLKIIGCYGMTEIGTSSFLRGLETTATYDRASQEFIINRFAKKEFVCSFYYSKVTHFLFFSFFSNSPTETATKFWIGLAGQVRKIVEPRFRCC